MAPASGSVTESKVYPAAVMDDQDGIVAGEQVVTVLSSPPFSSPNPETEALRMLPVEDGTSAHQAALDAEEVRNEKADADMKAADWKKEIDAAQDQEALDAVAVRYEESGAEYVSVESAFEARQAELDPDNDNS